MWIRISSWQIDHLGPLSSGTVTSWGGWRFWQRWHRLWSWLSVSVWGRCTCSFASPSCLQILWFAILARKASSCLVLTTHSRVSFYRSLQLSIPRKLNTPLLLPSVLGARFLHQELRFLYCGARKAFFGHFRHIQGQAHVGLFQLYPTSLPCLVADMLKTYQKLVAACNDEIRRLPQPYTLP